MRESGGSLEELGDVDKMRPVLVEELKSLANSNGHPIIYYDLDNAETVPLVTEFDKYQASPNLVTPEELVSRLLYAFHNSPGPQTTKPIQDLLTSLLTPVLSQLEPLLSPINHFLSSFASGLLSSPEDLLNGLLPILPFLSQKEKILDFEGKVKKELDILTKELEESIRRFGDRLISPKKSAPLKGGVTKTFLKGQICPNPNCLTRHQDSFAFLSSKNQLSLFKSNSTGPVSPILSKDFSSIIKTSANNRVFSSRKSLTFSKTQNIFGVTDYTANQFFLLDWSNAKVIGKFKCDWHDFLMGAIFFAGTSKEKVITYHFSGKIGIAKENQPQKSKKSNSELFLEVSSIHPKDQRAPITAMCQGVTHTGIVFFGDQNGMITRFNLAGGYPEWRFSQLKPEKTKKTQENSERNPGICQMLFNGSLNLLACSSESFVSVLECSAKAVVVWSHSWSSLRVLNQISWNKSGSFFAFETDSSLELFSRNSKEKSWEKCWKITERDLDFKGHKLAGMSVEWKNKMALVVSRGGEIIKVLLPKG